MSAIKCFVLTLPISLYIFFYLLARTSVNPMIILAVSALIGIAAASVMFILSRKAMGTKILDCLREVPDDTPKMKVRTYIFMFLSSVLSLGYLTQSSPLYPINTWCDTNIYFTVTKAMLNGKLLYRDINDQKGPLMYFLEMPGIIASDTSYIGVFIYEVVCCFIFLVFIYKTVSLFTKPGFVTDLLVCLMPFVIFSSHAFYLGGSAEEHMLPVCAATLYIGIKAIIQNRFPSVKETVILGILAGILFWVKYTLCGVFAGFVIYIIVSAVRSREFKTLFKLVISFLAGFALISLPVIIYFASSGALDSLYEGYFYNNVVVYMTAKTSDEPALPIVIRLLFTFIYFFANSDAIMFLMVFTGILFAALQKDKRLYAFLMLTFCISINFIFIGGYTMWYYVTIIYSFAVLSIIPLSKLLTRAVSAVQNKGAASCLAVILLVLTAVWAFLRSDATYLIFTPKHDTVQYQFAEIIDQEQDRTLVKYNFLDEGFYLATDTLPTIRYYCYYTDENAYENQQVELIEGRDTEFIVTRDQTPEFEGYAIVAESELISTALDLKRPLEEHTYYLYQLI